MFNELCRYCLQQWSLEVNLWRANCSLGNSLGFFVDSDEVSLVNHSTGCNLILVLKAFLGDKSWPGGPLSPSVFGNYI